MTKVFRVIVRLIENGLPDQLAAGGSLPRNNNRQGRPLLLFCIQGREDILFLCVIGKK